MKLVKLPLSPSPSSPVCLPVCLTVGVSFTLSIFPSLSSNHNDQQILLNIIQGTMALKLIDCNNIQHMSHLVTKGQVKVVII